MASQHGIFASYDDIWLLDAIRTPFADYNGALGVNSPTDMGIAVAKTLLARQPGIKPSVGHVFAGNMAQASFDAYMLPRHITLYAGLPLHVPSTLTQRICGTGIELLMQAADQVSLGRMNAGLCVGTESMSRNPMVAYTHRTGFKLGKVEFGDFLWEALTDPAIGCSMGQTAETLARQYRISRDEADQFAVRSFERALSAREAGHLKNEVISLQTVRFDMPGYQPRELSIRHHDATPLMHDSHPRPTTKSTLTALPAVFGGVQTAGNSAAIVDGASAALIGNRKTLLECNTQPLAKIRAISVVGVPPEIMGMGPAAAIRLLIEKTGLSLQEIGCFEINEAFAAQCLAVMRELSLDEGIVNLSGGAIAIGHPLAATGLRQVQTLARQMVRDHLQYGIASACIGGGQGIAILLEHPNNRK